MLAARTVTAEWWRGAVIYQVYPRSFADSNGDGTGDLPGLIGKLDYIASLGVDAIWVSPFYRSPMADFGYDISDYRDVDPVFGSLEDFDRLLAESHRRGLRVIVDQVLSHSSDRHPWFEESRRSRDNAKADWYVWADPQPDGTPPNNWLSIFGGSAWQWEPRRGQYYLHNFLVSQPDLNYHNPQVAEQMLVEAEFWLKRGVDGFRLDAINFCFHDAKLRSNPAKPEAERKGRGFTVDNPYAAQYHVYDNTQPETLTFIERLRALMNRYPGTMTLGEISCEDPFAAVRDYTEGDRRLHSAYCFELLVDRFSTGHVRDVFENLSKTAPNYWPCWAIGNHDVARVVSRWPQSGIDNVRRAKLMNAFLLSLRGTACTYQGEELGLTEVEVPREAIKDPYGIAFWPTFKGRDGCRTPMPWNATNQAGFSDGQPWLPIPDTHRGASVSLQEADRGSVLNAYRAMIRFRQSHAALRWGSMQLLPATDELLVFAREYEGQTVIAAFNFGASSTRMSLPVGTKIEALTGHGFEPCDIGPGVVELPPAGVFFGLLRSNKN
ncbi:MAG: alpha-glucosidase [Gammaproteobacteria bacterium]